MPTLRPYQSEAIAATLAAFDRVRRVLLVAPTGSGKTVLAAELISRFLSWGDSTVFLAHRQELIDQTCMKLNDVGVKHGVIMGSRPENRSAPVQVASVQTLIGRAKPPAGLIIVDEAHRARAKSYERIFTHYPRARILLLTATPWRTDGKGLGPVADELVVATTTAELQRQGYLAPYTGIVFRPLDVAGIQKSHGDFNEKQLGDAAMSDKGKQIAGDVVSEYVARCRRPDGTWRRAVVFAVNVAHSKYLADAFCKAGIRAEHADGQSMRPEDRRAVIARVRSGETSILCNCNLVTEGFDLPEMEVVILARPTQSVVMHLQQLGRVLRPADGKTYAIFHDHAGNLERLGCPDDDRDYSLTGDGPKKGREGGTGAKQCWKCKQKYFGGGADCPSCGARPEDRPAEAPDDVEVIRDVEAVRIEDIRAHKAARDAQEDLERNLRLNMLRGFCLDALRKGHNPVSARFRYEEKFGSKPAWREYEDALAWARQQLPPDVVEKQAQRYQEQRQKKSEPQKSHREEARQRVAEEFRRAAMGGLFDAAERVAEEPAAHRTVSEDEFMRMLNGTAPALTMERLTLGVSADATAVEIRSAYRRLAHEHHPDRGGSHERMAAINAAYNKLMGSS